MLSKVRMTARTSRWKFKLVRRYSSIGDTSNKIKKGTMINVEKTAAINAFFLRLDLIIKESISSTPLNLN